MNIADCHRRKNAAGQMEVFVDSVSFWKIRLAKDAGNVLSSLKSNTKHEEFFNWMTFTFLLTSFDHVFNQHG